MKKLTNTILYFLQRLSDRPPPKTSLLKLIFLADLEHYRRHLRTITEVEYAALPMGPVPDNYDAILSSLVRDGVLTYREVPVFNSSRPKEEFQPLLEPDLGSFMESELEVLDAVLSDHGRKKARRLVELTHSDGPWKLVYDSKNQGRRIPRELFRWLDNLADDDDVAWAREALSGVDVDELRRKALAGA